jgi:lysyl-tRNA synthetase class 2
MLEWYRAWDDLDAIARDTEQLVAHVATAVNGKPQVKVGGRKIAVDGPWLRLTVAEAMYDHAGVEVRGDESVARADRGGARRRPRPRHRAALGRRVLHRVRRAGRAGAGGDRSPGAAGRLAGAAGALAQRKPGNPAVCRALRGLHRRRRAGQRVRRADRSARAAGALRGRSGDAPARGLPQYPIDEKLLAALGEGLPPSAGIALGVDRLAMLVLGAGTIGDVLAFAAGEI